MAFKNPFFLIMLKLTKSFFTSSLISMVMLSACGGGGGGGSGGSNSSTANVSSEATIKSLLSSSNASNTYFPWNDSAYAVCSGKTKRWNLPIEVRAPFASTSARATTAMNTIEAKLGFTVFNRSNLSTAPSGGFVGIIFSDAGQSYIPPGQTPVSGSTYEANVSAGPNLGNWPSAVLDANCAISTALYINLDNSSFTAGADVTVHEFGHALGLGEHFSGFGNGAAISKDFWDVLATLYGTNAGTTASTVTVVRVN